MKDIYMIGICGVAMGSLALMLREKGCNVSGSDENIYPPMSDILHNSNIRLYNKFSADNLVNPDLVIIGNAISRGNLEVESVLNRKIPYMSMSRALYNFFLEGKEVISISGTHGKSTTAALLAHILETAEMSPSFFIGGVVKNYNSNYKLGKGKYFVVEGDEYDSAFFEKVPKFTFYRPDHLILTSLEFDHADIYKDIDEIKLWFRRLVNIIPSKGNIVYSGEYSNLREIISNSFSRNYSFNKNNSDFRYQFTGYKEDYADLLIHSHIYDTLDIKSRIFGEHNYSNITAAASMAMLLGISGELIRKGVETFKGVLRRQDVIYKRENLIIYEDFAHHPTSIGLMLNTIRHRYPERYLWAIYEPRSATSRRNIFQDRLPDSFSAADIVIIKTPYRLNSIKKEERLDVDKLCDDIHSRGGEVYLYNDVNNIIQFVEENIDTTKKNIIVIMSNGGFDGIYSKITGTLDSLFKNSNIIA